MPEYVINHIISDKSLNQTTMNVVAFYSDLGGFLNAMSQIDSMMMSVRNRIVQENSIDSIINNPPIISYQNFGYEDLGGNAMAEDGNLLGKLKSITININGILHIYKGMIV